MLPRAAQWTVKLQQQQQQVHSQGKGDAPLKAISWLGVVNAPDPHPNQELQGIQLGWREYVFYAGCCLVRLVWRAWTKVAKLQEPDISNKISRVKVAFVILWSRKVTEIGAD